MFVDAGDDETHVRRGVVKWSGDVDVDCIPWRETYRRIFERFSRFRCRFLRVLASSAIAYEALCVAIHLGPPILQAQKAFHSDDAGVTFMCFLKHCVPQFCGRDDSLIAH